MDVLLKGAWGSERKLLTRNTFYFSALAAAALPEGPRPKKGGVWFALRCEGKRASSGEQRFLISEC